MTISDNPPTAAEKTAGLLAVCLAAAAMPLTFTGPAVALTDIGRSLGGSPIALNWVTNAFMLTFGSALMAAGALADHHGRKRVFLAGTGAFALFSLGLIAAPNILWFDLLRAAQGLAAAAAFAGGMAALAQEFDGHARTRAFSIVGTSFGVGLSLGPIASAMMIDAFGWRSIFVLVLALVGPSFVLAARVLRDSRDPAAKGLDWGGAISFTAALTLFTFGVLLAPQRGWVDSRVIALLIGAAALFAVFGLIEKRVARPMLDLTLFRYPRFVGVQLLAAAPAYAFVVLLILLPIRFVGIEGMSVIGAGQLMIALSAPLLILPILAGLLTRLLSPAIICGIGLLVSAGGLFWLSGVPVGLAHSFLVAPLAMIGIGISLPWGLMDGLAVSVVPKERAGMATGIFSTTRVAGEGVALAVVSAILSAMTAAHLPGGSATAAQRLATGDLAGAAAALPGVARALLVQGYSAAFGTLLLLLTGITVLTAIVVFLFLGRGEQPTQVALRECPAVGD
ncbi:MFS transporter [Acidisoma silvae]|uniref:MFS transporter n=1 Tax=Acidisoma silvae TaxID=2802396 RepID=A0A964E0L9_9PROT|nr:MFS transporter [Acidisoma silvae]MCB8876858.1 MFS transporter [Acidisoma silvae]